MDQLLPQIKEYLDLLTGIIVVFGVPFAAWKFFKEQRRSREEHFKDRREAEYRTYDALDERYLEYQTLCFEHPELDIADVPLAAPRPLTPEQKKQEQIAFIILITMFERAYVMFADQSDELRQRQWAGWKQYMLEFNSRQNFQEEWRDLGYSFDLSFTDYMSELTGVRPPNSSLSQ